MFLNFLKRRRSNGRIDRRKSGDIAPDEIFLDSYNLPSFDQNQLEGRLQSPLALRTFFITAGVFALIIFIFAGRIWHLQVVNGAEYNKQSEENRLRHTLIFAERGLIFDRLGEVLAENVPKVEATEFSLRHYVPIPGIAHAVGYLKYPSKDSAGFYYNTEFQGIDGTEKWFNNELEGKNGLRIIETDALGAIRSESRLLPPESGNSVTLSIDSRISKKLYESMENLARSAGFSGGAGVIMDVKNGELLALTSFPEYQSQTLTDGKNKSIVSYLEDERKPFLNRTTNGLYTPGSIIKPFIALGALTEGVIKPETIINVTGSISVPNAYDPKKKTLFNDWKAHGPVDMREALAVSSNVYFFEVGGGFESQKGLGISGVERYLRMFGFGELFPDIPFSGTAGIVPNPAWKEENFKDGVWRIGDTYNTSIGQYGLQVTPLEAVRAVSAVATDGVLIRPTLLLGDGNGVIEKTITLPKEHFKVVREGMHLAVLHGTAKNLNIQAVTLAAKTGTAEIGVSKKTVNSWIIGFFPYENPRFAFTVIMERGARENTIGALYVMRELLEWMAVYTPEYLK